jgi:hypothetical protein
MNDDQIMNMLLIMSNMTSSLSKISIHMEEIVEKLDSIDNNMVYLGCTMEDIKDEEIS